MRAWRREKAWFRGYVRLGLRIRVYTSGVAPDPGIPRSRGTRHIRTLLHAHARRILPELIVSGRPRFRGYIWCPKCLFLHTHLRRISRVRPLAQQNRPAFCAPSTSSVIATVRLHRWPEESEEPIERGHYHVAVHSNSSMFHPW